MNLQELSYLLLRYYEVYKKYNTYYQNATIINKTYYTKSNLSIATVLKFLSLNVFVLMKGTLQSFCVKLADRRPYRFGVSWHNSWVKNVGAVPAEHLYIKVRIFWVILTLTGNQCKSYRACLELSYFRRLTCLRRSC